MVSVPERRHTHTAGRTSDFYLTNKISEDKMLEMCPGCLSSGNVATKCSPLRYIGLWDSPSAKIRMTSRSSIRADMSPPPPPGRCHPSLVVHGDDSSDVPWPLWPNLWFQQSRFVLDKTASLPSIELFALVQNLCPKVLRPKFWSVVLGICLSPLVAKYRRALVGARD